MHRKVGVQDPNRHNPLLTLTLRGVRRSHYTTTPARKPITTPIFRNLLARMEESKLGPHDRYMLSAAFTMAFYGLLRVSEFTAPSQHKFDPREDPNISNIMWHRKYFTCHLKRSKTDQLHQGQNIFIPKVNTDTFQFHTMQRYWEYRKEHSTKLTQTPLFVFRNGTPLTRKTLLYHLRVCLTKGVSQPSYTVHTVSGLEEQHLQVPAGSHPNKSKPRANGRVVHTNRM